jgi:mycoredoxin
MKHKNLIFYGATWCGDCRRPKEFLDKHNIAYNYVDIDKKPQAALEVARINKGLQSIPTIVFPDGTILVEPSIEELRIMFKQETH